MFQNHIFNKKSHFRNQFCLKITFYKPFFAKIAFSKYHFSLKHFYFKCQIQVNLWTKTVILPQCATKIQLIQSVRKSYKKSHIASLLKAKRAKLIFYYNVRSAFISKFRSDTRYSRNDKKHRLNRSKWCLSFLV